jgi:hypothetical protein
MLLLWLWLCASTSPLFADRQKGVGSQGVESGIPRECVNKSYPHHWFCPLIAQGQGLDLADARVVFQPTQCCNSIAAAEVLCTVHALAGCSHGIDVDDNAVTADNRQCLIAAPQWQIRPRIR